MKKVVPILFTLFILGSVSAWAADEFPKAEVFGGFSVLSMGEGGDRWNPLGFQASVAGNVTKNFGIVGDFGGQYKDGSHVYEYMGGPRFTARSAKASAFVHALFGGATFGGGSGTDSSSENAFAMGLGGGIDVNANKHLAIRLIQFDWIPVKSSGIWFKNQVRFGFGIVFK